MTLLLAIADSVGCTSSALADVRLAYGANPIKILACADPTAAPLHGLDGAIFASDECDELRRCRAPQLCLAVMLCRYVFAGFSLLHSHNYKFWAIFTQKPFFWSACHFFRLFGVRISFDGASLGSRPTTYYTIE